MYTVLVLAPVCDCTQCRSDVECVAFSLSRLPTRTAIVRAVVYGPNRDSHNCPESNPSFPDDRIRFSGPFRKLVLTVQCDVTRLPHDSPLSLESFINSVYSPVYSVTSPCHVPLYADDAIVSSHKLDDCLVLKIVCT